MVGMTDWTNLRKMSRYLQQPRVPVTPTEPTPIASECSFCDLHVNTKVAATLGDCFNDLLHHISMSKIVVKSPKGLQSVSSLINETLLAGMHWSHGRTGYVRVCLHRHSFVDVILTNVVVNLLRWQRFSFLTLNSKRHTHIVSLV